MSTNNSEKLLDDLDIYKDSNDIEFISFKKFNNKVDVQEFTNLLDKNGIQYEFENESTSFDPSFSFNELNQVLNIKLLKKDFEKVNNLLFNISQNTLDDIEEDYYLFSFNNEELWELVKNQDLWSEFDVLLAQKILKERGENVNEEKLNLLKNERMKALSKTDKLHNYWIVSAYLGNIFPTIFASFFARNILNTSKILPNGDKVYVYSDEDRTHAKRMLFLSKIFLIFWIVLAIIFILFKK